MTFQTAVDFVFGLEGYLSDDPLDTGGLTKFGIASKWHPEVLDPKFSCKDAQAIYKKDYWDACRCDSLPDGVDLMVFDAAVQHDVKDAVKMLQRSAGVKADGIIGQVTLDRVSRMDRKDVISGMVARRALHYAKLPQLDHFGLGWYLRLAKVVVRAL
jgi:lysozyme family protein